MKRVLTSFWTARVLVILGFLLGWNSLSATAGHIGNPQTLLVGEWDSRRTAGTISLGN